MKRVFCFILIILIISSGICVWILPSKNTDKINLIYQKNLLNYLPEKDEVITSFEKEKRNTLKGAENYIGKRFIKLELENTLKMHYLKPVDVYKEFKSGKKLNELISDDCFYIVPITRFGINKGLIHLKKQKKVDEKELNCMGLSEDTIEEIKEKEGKITSTQMRPMIEDHGYEFFTDSDKIIKKLKSNNIEEITDIKFISAFHLDFAYINSSMGEFCVPFLSRPEFYNITNGKLYKMNDIIRILKIEYENNGFDISLQK